MRTKTSGSSQATWALLAEGASAARIEAHRLRADLSRAMKLIESSGHREQVYRLAGDLLEQAPHRVTALERHLDRTCYALSLLGKDNLRDTLPLYDRKLVDDAVERSSPMFPAQLTRSAERVASRYLEARAPDLREIGYPGGSCQVIRRIRQALPPAVAEPLVDQVEVGLSLESADLTPVYPPQVSEGIPGTFFTRVALTVHGQYRMDYRHVTLSWVRHLLKSFYDYYMGLLSKQDVRAVKLTDQLLRGVRIEWESKEGYEIVFNTSNVRGVLRGSREAVVSCTANVITVIDLKSNSRPPGEGGCDDWKPSR